MSEYKPKQPLDSFPLAFSVIVREGKGYLAPAMTPWTAVSTRLRFRWYVRRLREEPTHALHARAHSLEWAMSIDAGGGLWIRSKPRTRRPRVGKNSDESS